MPALSGVLICGFKCRNFYLRTSVGVRPSRSVVLFVPGERGGVYPGRSFSAALMDTQPEADGAALGTGHLTAVEADAADRLKQRISEAGEQHAELVGPPICGNWYGQRTGRVAVL